ncbi:MAG: tRNA (guanosine(46)-N7)-methyltransferase TrmB, partial [Saprospiraceae bacterium]
MYLEGDKYLYSKLNIEDFPNYKSEVTIKWKNHFKNENPITLELACGGGEYTVALAERYPDRNFIGVDVKGARIYKGAKVALGKDLDNAAFLRCRIEQIYEFFAEGEIDEIWITFPDPFLRESKENRRLTSSFFIDQYRKILKEKGIVQLKTDSQPLYQFTLETLGEKEGCTLIYEEENIYSKELYISELETKTAYERKHLENGLTIKYVRFLVN